MERDNGFVSMLMEAQRKEEEGGWSERGNVQNQIAQRGRICLNDTPPLYFARLRGRPVHSSLLFFFSAVYIFIALLQLAYNKCVSLTLPTPLVLVSFLSGIYNPFGVAGRGASVSPFLKDPPTE